MGQDEPWPTVHKECQAQVSRNLFQAEPCVSDAVPAVSGSQAKRSRTPMDYSRAPVDELSQGTSWSTLDAFLREPIGDVSQDELQVCPRCNDVFEPQNFKAFFKKQRRAQTTIVAPLICYYQNDKGRWVSDESDAVY